MRSRFASTFLVTCVLAACGGRQHQHLGTGQVSIAGRPASAPPVALPAQTPGGRYRVHYQVWLPRAMEVSWTLRCGGHEERGVMGETFEQYLVRRTAEIKAERERERQRRAQVGSLIGGAVLGQAQAGAAVATPDANAQATVTVDGAAAGAAVGAATVTDAPIVLAPDDLGQGYRQGDIGFQLGDALGDGGCAMELTPVDPAIDTQLLAGTYAVERWYDAKRAERVRVAGGVTTVRADLRARLIARGADPELAARKRAEADARMAEQRAAEDARRAQLDAERQTRIAAETARQVEEERRARLEIEANAKLELELEAHIRAEVLSTREALYVYYGRCGGNRHRREELAAEQEQRRLRIEAEARLRLKMSLDIRARLRGELVARGADPGLRDRLLAEAAARHERDAAERRRRIAAAEEDARHRAAEAEAAAAADLAAFEAEQAERDRRVSIAVGVRAQMVDSLLAMGARLRPPMPAAVDDRGHWAWSGAQWMWIEGDVGISVPVNLDLGVSAGGGARASGGTYVDTSREPVREHRSTVGDSLAQPAPPPRSPPRERERDHRDHAPSTTTTTTVTPPPPVQPARPPVQPVPPPTRPRVRDHR
ncbi:MAG TPA: hypothetical protein VM261_24505 [Kofleriaceae bacterium]|nr:hypothetical protein [Kofleriaceae bacterium]